MVVRIVSFTQRLMVMSLSAGLAAYAIQITEDHGTGAQRDVRAPIEGEPICPIPRRCPRLIRGARRCAAPVMSARSPYSLVRRTRMLLAAECGCGRSAESGARRMLGRDRSHSSVGSARHAALRWSPGCDPVRALLRGQWKREQGACGNDETAHKEGRSGETSATMRTEQLSVNVCPIGLGGHSRFSN